jgi:hypothetical protein
LPWQMFLWVIKINFKHDIWSLCTISFAISQLKINWLRCVGISILASMFKTCMSVSVQYNLIGSVWCNLLQFDESFLSFDESLLNQICLSCKFNKRGLWLYQIRFNFKKCRIL